MGEKLEQLAFGLFALFIAGELALWSLFGTTGDLPWLWFRFGAVVCAASVQVIFLLRWLPVQNVVACALTIGACSILYALMIGPGFDLGIAFEPILWIATLLCSRGTARVFLKRYRGRPFYGPSLIALGVMLGFIAYLGVVGNRSELLGSWRSAAWLFGAAVALLAIVPWTIDKRGLGPPSDRYSLWIWLI